MPAGLAETGHNAIFFPGRPVAAAGLEEGVGDQQAFQMATQLASTIPDLVSRHGGEESRATIGKVEVRPSFAPTIPGEAAFSLVLRDTEEDRPATLGDRLRDTIARVAAEHGLGREIAARGRIRPTMLAPDIVSLLGDEARALGLYPLTMPSEAGHDARTMQALCPSGLIFVPSRGGISHSPDEWTDWNAVLEGARLMLTAATRLACSGLRAA